MKFETGLGHLEFTGRGLKGLNYCAQDNIDKFWINGYLSYINIIDKYIYDYEAHQLYISNLNRFSNKICERNDHKNKDEVSYLTKVYQEPQVYIFYDNKFILYDKFSACWKINSQFIL